MDNQNRCTSSSTPGSGTNETNETPPPNPSPRVGAGMEPSSLVSLLLGTPPTPSEPSPSADTGRNRNLSAMSDVERRRFLSDVLTSALAIADEQIGELDSNETEEDIRHRQDDPTRDRQ